MEGSLSSPCWASVVNTYWPLMIILSGHLRAWPSTRHWVCDHFGILLPVTRTLFSNLNVPTGFSLSPRPLYLPCILYDLIAAVPSFTHRLFLYGSSGDSLGFRIRFWLHEGCSVAKRTWMKIPSTVTQPFTYNFRTRSPFAHWNSWSILS